MYNGTGTLLQRCFVTFLLFESFPAERVDVKGIQVLETCLVSFVSITFYVKYICTPLFKSLETVVIFAFKIFKWMCISAIFDISWHLLFNVLPFNMRYLALVARTFHLSVRGKCHPVATY